MDQCRLSLSKKKELHFNRHKNTNLLNLSIFFNRSKKSIQVPSTENCCVDGTLFICSNCGYCNSAFAISDPSADSKNSCSADNRTDVENELMHSPIRSAKRRLRYPGDVKENEDLTPRSSKKFIRNLKTTVKKQRIKIQGLNKTKRRAYKRISTLKSLVNDLKKKNLVSENALESLKVFGFTMERVVKLYCSCSLL